jgi:hypothetical protein
MQSTAILHFKKDTDNNKPSWYPDVPPYQKRYFEDHLWLNRTWFESWIDLLPYRNKIIYLREKEPLNISVETKPPVGAPDKRPLISDDRRTTPIEHGIAFFCVYGVWWDGTPFPVSFTKPEPPPDPPVMIGYDDWYLPFRFDEATPYRLIYSFNNAEKGTHLHYPPGSKITWFVGVMNRTYNKTTFEYEDEYLYTLRWNKNTKQLDYLFYTEILGAWPSNRSFEDNLDVTFEPTSPTVFHDVNVTISIKNKMYKGYKNYREIVKIGGGYISANITYPNGTWWEDFEYIAEFKFSEPGTKDYRLYANATIPHLHPLTGKCFPPNTVIRFNITAWDKLDPCYQFHMLTSKNYYYTISDAGSFVNKDFKLDIEISSNPDVIPPPSDIELKPGVEVEIRLKSKYEDVPIMGASIWYKVQQGEYETDFVERACTKITPAEWLGTIPPQGPGTNVSFYVTVVDINNTELTSSVYKYSTPRPKAGEPVDEYSIWFEVRVINDRTGLGEPNVLVHFENYTKPPRYYCNTTTDAVGIAYPYQTDKTKLPKGITNETYVQIPFTKNETYYIWIFYEQNFTLYANVTMPTGEKVREHLKVIDEGKIWHAGRCRYFKYKIIHDLNNNTLVFHVDRPKPPPIYARPEGFSQWFLYMTYASVAILVVPIVVYLDIRRKKAKEEEKRITL